MMSLVAPGLAAGAAGLAAGVGAAAAGSLAAGSAVAGVGGVAAAGAAPPAFCARILARISAVDGLFCSIAIQITSNSQHVTRVRGARPDSKTANRPGCLRILSGSRRTDNYNGIAPPGFLRTKKCLEPRDVITLKVMIALGLSPKSSVVGPQESEVLRLRLQPQGQVLSDL